MKYIQERLRAIVEKSGSPVNNLIRGTGLSNATLRIMLEDPEYSPGLKSICAISEYFHVPMDYFFDRFSDEEAEKLQENYYAFFQNLRREAYEGYIRAGHHKKKVYDKIESPWPYNLLDDIFQMDTDWILSDEQFKEFEDTILKVPYIEKYYEKIVLEKYKNGKTLEQIGEKLGFNRERARQILARCRMIMRHKRFIKYLKSDWDMIAEKKKILEHDISTLENKKQALEVVIEEMQSKLDETEELVEIKNMNMGVYSTVLEDVLDSADISVRAFNCLKRSGYHTIGDVVRASGTGKLGNIRNMGKKTREEIFSCIKNRTGIEMVV